jgi:hypothetical protein
MKYSLYMITLQPSLQKWPVGRLLGRRRRRRRRRRTRGRSSENGKQAKKEKVRHYPAVMHPNMSFLLSRSSDEIQSLHFSAVSAEMACRPASWEEEEEAAEEENQGPQ